jgi:oligoribonuclease NrnB/cAMP/cGMP phosphodiesterase (DHH superfamily)
MEENLIEKVAELLKQSEKWMIRDDEGNLHELNAGIKGVPELVTAKKEIYNLFFGKERISAANLRQLDEVVTELVKFIWDNFTYKVKTESQEELKSIIQKYNLKELKKRSKQE